MLIGGTKWLYNFSVCLKFAFINIEIHDEAISENLHHLVKHVDITVDVTYYEVKMQSWQYHIVECFVFNVLDNDVSETAKRTESIFRLNARPISGSVHQRVKVQLFP